MTKNSIAHSSCQVRFDELLKSENESKSDDDLDVLMTEKFLDVKLHTEVLLVVPICSGRKQCKCFQACVNSCATCTLMHPTVHAILDYKSHTKKGDSKSWKTRNGIFYNSEEVEMDKCMLSSMTIKHEFTIKCNIMPNEFLPYGFILGNFFLKDLNFEAWIVEDKSTWDDLKQPWFHMDIG